VPRSADKAYGYGGYGYKGSRSPVAEAFRVLRTNLQFAAVDKELKVILVTSAIPDEGKSTVVQYLGQTISQTGKKVMIVDCDLINPTLHRRFGIPNQRGLSNLIVGDADYTVYNTLKDFPNLSVITSGPIPPNSSELLGSQRMKHLVERLRGEYDTIILDTPPVLPVTDAVVLSALADGVVLVMESGRARSDDVRRAKESLASAHVDLLGVVLTRVRRRHAHGYYGKGYGNYGSYGETAPTPEEEKK
jgi:capsular exopolysaccharide synthesis family protein